MPDTNQLNLLLEEFSGDKVAMGEIKKRAKIIKCDHELGLALWASGKLYPRMLAVLIFDKKLIDQDFIDQLTDDMLSHDDAEQNHLSEWFMANQLMKSKSATALMVTWQYAESAILRRLFWYHQARLRWTGQPSPENTLALLDSIEQDLATEEPNVQWAMNFCAAQIGIFQAELRERCIALGERLGLYREEKAPKNCTPNYLPEFIRIEVGKREN